MFFLLMAAIGLAGLIVRQILIWQYEDSLEKMVSSDIESEGS